MRRLLAGSAVLVLAAGLSVASPKAGSQSFVGSISDSMCGIKHMMPGGDKACTEACVKAGAKYVLADAAHNKVYKLSDQSKAAAYSGERVKVVGSLDGDTIQVISIARQK
jgi:hypothetical protein